MRLAVPYFINKNLVGDKNVYCPLNFSFARWSENYLSNLALQTRETARIVLVLQKKPLSSALYSRKSDPQSRAYFQGRVYIRNTLKNHVEANFQERLLEVTCNLPAVWELSYETCGHIESVL